VTHDDGAGALDSAFDINGLSRKDLCVLGREWLLHGHLQDRVGIPLVLEHSDRQTMQQVAIDEWMAASPVYSRRMQRALGFAGTGVDTIFKNLQLDIGAPHQFLDFCFTLHDSRHGEFHLPWCGALMDVEPLGDEFVVGMCHTIEDPTFDATAGAVNPYAQVRPVHRPPRIPAHRQPHCRWTVTIGDGPPVTAHPNEALVESSRAAQIQLPELPVGGDSEPGGWSDYAGPFDPGFQFEDLSHPALLVAVREVALQSHLLFRGYLLSVRQRFGAGMAETLAPRVFMGLGALTSERLRAAMRLPDRAAGIARLLQIHPMFNPSGYVDATTELLDDRRVRFVIHPCPATEEPDRLTWFTALGRDACGPAALAALVHGAEPRAGVTSITTAGGEHLAFLLDVDPAAEPVPEPPELQLAKLSKGAGFVFRQRRHLRASS
jgi:hypothetical protein